MSRSSVPVPVIISKIEKSKKPIVIVEGPDDIIVYRQLITFYSNKGLTVLPAGGRDKALQVFELIKDRELINKVIFIVDKDLWVFSDIPDKNKHQRVLTTQGYSIENDIFTDGNVEELMKGEGCFQKFKSDLKEYLGWYSITIDQHLRGNNNSPIDVSAKVFFEDVSFANNVKTVKKANQFPADLHTQILSDYSNKLRGKNLLDMAIWYLNKNKDAGIFHKTSYIKIIASTQRGSCLNNIFDRVGQLC